MQNEVTQLEKELDLLSKKIGQGFVERTITIRSANVFSTLISEAKEKLSSVTGVQTLIDVQKTIQQVRCLF